MAAPLIYIHPSNGSFVVVYSMFVKQVNEETELTLSTLARPIPSDGAVHLYATNLEVDIHNHDCLEAMQEQLHVYQVHRY